MLGTICELQTRRWLLTAVTLAAVNDGSARRLTEKVISGWSTSTRYFLYGELARVAATATGAPVAISTDGIGPRPSEGEWQPEPAGSLDGAMGRARRLPQGAWRRPQPVAANQRLRV